MMRDADFGNIRLRGFGVYSFKVENPKMFMTEIFGQSQVYKVSEIEGQVRPMLLQALTDAIAESKISALDLASNYNEFSDNVLECAKDKFSKFGLKLCTIVIENLSLPEEVERALDERTKLGVLEDKMGTYTQYQAANAMRDAAQNEGGGNLAGLGVGLGAGTAIGNMFGQSLNMQNQNKNSNNNQSDVEANKVPCVKCGHLLSPNAKFCPECGSKQGLVCEKCGATLTKNAKFCPECGTPTGKTCKKCGATLSKKVKFCPECGEKIDE